MTDFESLYNQKVSEYTALELEYKEFKETSKFFEEELENQTSMLQQQNTVLEKQLEKITQEFKNFKNEIEKTIKSQDKLIKNNNIEKEEYCNQIKKLQKSLIEIENEYEECQNQLRQSQDVIISQEQKSELLMEQLSLAQLENEDNQNKNQEQIQRLREQIKEYESDLKVIHIKNQKYFEESDVRHEIHLSQKLQNAQQSQQTPLLKQINSSEEEKSNEDCNATTQKKMYCNRLINPKKEGFQKFLTPNSSPIIKVSRNSLSNQSNLQNNQIHEEQIYTSNFAYSNKLNNSVLILNNIIKNLDNSLKQIQSPRKVFVRQDYNKKSNIVNC